MSTSAPDSRWWYLVLAVPVFYALATVLSFVVGFVAFVATLVGVTGGVGGGPGSSELAVGFGVVGIVGLVLLVVLVGLVLSLAFPIALYFDAEALADADTTWQPDPALYGLLGLASVVAQPLQIPLGVYYLYKRHEAVGVP
ncbi:hypothetical protein [Halobacterium zhouii]|uniref:hypothetical protein n=1 Tax=Halobacterium zhouii TaxID=2902624 RepID=UPI001E61FFAC|nr:hypothetical protein [Halobacterium zhouii]